MKLKNLLLLIFALFLSTLNANTLLLNDSFVKDNSILSAGAFLPTATVTTTTRLFARMGLLKLLLPVLTERHRILSRIISTVVQDITVTTTTGDSVTVTVDTSVDGVFDFNLTNVAFGTNPGDSQAQAQTATVTVKPLPTAAATGSITVCINALASEVTFTGTGGLIPYTFTYTINNGSEITVSTVNTNSVNVSVPTGTPGTFAYKIVKISSGGTCEQVQSSTATVKVFGIPSAAVSGTATVCMNDDKPNITFTGTGGEPPYAFTYNVNNSSDPNNYHLS
ncbi:hypothetical protein [Flavobacterium sp. 3HN19-14]|uniref:hypothetical protein n=1 Tax=Flavobacterium sp. 3HN19-14 TaxID=3448133 RepID=UPI003EE39D8C